jgi:hypothetical protein
MKTGSAYLAAIRGGIPGYALAQGMGNAPGRGVIVENRTSHTPSVK